MASHLLLDIGVLKPALDTLQIPFEITKKA